MYLFIYYDQQILQFSDCIEGTFIVAYDFKITELDSQIGISELNGPL